MVWRRRQRWTRSIAGRPQTVTTTRAANSPGQPSTPSSASSDRLLSATSVAHVGPEIGDERRTQHSVSGSGGRVVAAAQVALERLRDRVTGRLRQRRLVLPLLERLDVLRDLAVLARELVDTVLPVA